VLTKGVGGQCGFFIGRGQTMLPLTDIFYMTVFPRHVTECCETHLTRDVVVLMDGSWRDMDRDVMETVWEKDGTVNFLKWWLWLLGMETDVTLEETRRSGIVDKDGVHPTEKVNRNAAVFYAPGVLIARWCGILRKIHEEDQMVEEQEEPGIRT
jgi:hypothetical protein